ncbi:MAG: site-specific integrase [Lachnospiraceae bacterium]|nr:site-specific integrase [Lachnospiraceae bacterium]
MTVTKNEKGLWDVQFYYKDYRGKNIKKHKRNFKTKREAVEWAGKYIDQQSHNLDMKFSSFYQLYREDMATRLRENTVRTKEYITELKILPYFGEKKISRITAADIRRWQNSLMKQGYSPTYLKTINNQLSAIFNYAVKYYDLPKNPCAQAGSMGKGRAAEMQFWTQEEFEAFIECIKDKPVPYYAFLTLYWTGVRLGELLALTLADFDAGKKTLSITKSYQRINGKDVITEPKTPKGKRTITLPDFFVAQLEDYVSRLYGMMPNDRLFLTTKSCLEKEMNRGTELSGVKKIRIHDLRHSHASLLISKLGVQPKLVSERLGHEKIQTTLDTYSHLYPDQSRDVANQLDGLMDEFDGKEGDNDAGET